MSGSGRSGRFYADSAGASRVYDYDLNLNGLTNAADQSIIEANLGFECGA